MKSVKVPELQIDLLIDFQAGSRCGAVALVSCEFGETSDGKTARKSLARKVNAVLLKTCGSQL